ncbi:unnamed protein product [Durusdinium trenchii]|uniref:Uncharacterized protein n=1 Tax=Durusdinium trenchii TaxID=1381693 RepID=A0ABP0MZJ7_9DINO
MHLKGSAQTNAHTHKTSTRSVGPLRVQLTLVQRWATHPRGCLNVTLYTLSCLGLWNGSSTGCDCLVTAAPVNHCLRNPKTTHEMQRKVRLRWTELSHTKPTMPLTNLRLLMDVLEHK